MKKAKAIYTFYRNHVSVEDTTSLAYYFILSIVPAATLLTVLLQFFHLDISKITFLDLSLMSEDVLELLQSVIASRNVSAYSIISLGICLYVCSKGVYRMTKNVNYMYKVDSLPFVPARFFAAVDTLLILLLIIGIVLFVTVVPFIFRFFHLSPLWNMVKYGGSFFYSFIVMVMINMLVPSLKLRFKEVYLGSLVTSVLFILIIFGFSIYLRFANYSTVYGPFASLAVLLMIFDFFSKAIYLGYAINAFNKTKEYM